MGTLQKVSVSWGTLSSDQLSVRRGAQDLPVPSLRSRPVRFKPHDHTSAELPLLAAARSDASPELEHLESVRDFQRLIKRVRIIWKPQVLCQPHYHYPVAMFWKHRLSFSTKSQSWYNSRSVCSQACTTNLCRNMKPITTRDVQLQTLAALGRSALSGHKSSVSSGGVAWDYPLQNWIVPSTQQSPHHLIIIFSDICPSRPLTTYRMSWILKAVLKFNFHPFITLMLFLCFVLLLFLASMMFPCCFVLFLQNHRKTPDSDASPLW